MYLILLIDLAELDNSIILYICVREISTLLKVLLIGLEPSINGRVLADEILLTKMHFNVDDEIASASDEYCVDE